MADPKKTEYTPEELRDAKSNFDPAKVAAESTSAAGATGQTVRGHLQKPRTSSVGGPVRPPWSTTTRTEVARSTW